MTTTKTIITKPDTYGSKLKDAKRVVAMSTERGVPINTAASTVATAGGWADNKERIDEVAKMARYILGAGI